MRFSLGTLVEFFMVLVKMIIETTHIVIRELLLRDVEHHFTIVVDVKITSGSCIDVTLVSVEILHDMGHMFKSGIFKLELSLRLLYQVCIVEVLIEHS